jgi:hypothetical protein
MEKENLLCLVIADYKYSCHKLLRVDEVPKTLLEIDLENHRWRNLGNQKWDNRTNWNKIGKPGHNYVRLVFDYTNFKHLKMAIEVAENLLR